MTSKYEQHSRDFAKEQTAKEQRRRLAKYVPGRLVGFEVYDIIPTDKVEKFTAALKRLPQNESKYLLHWLREDTIERSDGPLMGGGWQNVGMLVRPAKGERDHFFHAIRHDLPDGIDALSCTLATLRDGNLFVAYGFRIEKPDEAAFKDGYLHAGDIEAIVEVNTDKRKGTRYASRGHTVLDDFPIIQAGVDWVADHMPSDYLTEERWRQSAPIHPVVVMGDATTPYLCGKDHDMENYLVGRPYLTGHSNGTYLIRELKERLKVRGGPSRGFLTVLPWTKALDDKGELSGWHVMSDFEFQHTFWLPALYAFYFTSATLVLHLPEAQELGDKARKQFRACLSLSDGRLRLLRLKEASGAHSHSSIVHQGLLELQYRRASFERRIDLALACNDLQDFRRLEGSNGETFDNDLSKYIANMKNEGAAALDLLERQLQADVTFAQSSLETRIGSSNWALAVIAVILAVVAILVSLNT